MFQKKRKKEKQLMELPFRSSDGYFIINGAPAAAAAAAAAADACCT